MAWTTPTTWTTGQVVTASNMNTYVSNNTSFLYGDTAWTAPTFTNSWVDFATGTGPTGFRLIGTRVVLRGGIKSGTIAASAFTLPSGYRPTAQCNFIVDSNAAVGVIQINSTGTVLPNTGSNVYFMLDGISFDTI